jgi:hypothetical protein
MSSINPNPHKGIDRQILAAWIAFAGAVIIAVSTILAAIITKPSALEPVRPTQIPLIPPTVGAFPIIPTPLNTPPLVGGQSQEQVVASAPSATLPSIGDQSTAQSEVLEPTKTSPSVIIATPPPEEIPTATFEPSTVAVATEQAVSTVINGLTSQAVHIYGPKNGVLVEQSNNMLAQLSVGRANLVQNFMAKATLRNPYDATEAWWTYGFMFRSTGLNRHYRIYIDSYRTWELHLYNLPGNEADVPKTPTPTPIPRTDIKVIAQGTIPDLNLSAKGRNTIFLTVNDSIGYLVVNDNFVTTFDLSEKITQGAVLLFAQLDEGKAGIETEYSDFTVWSLP